jgi:membrane protease subunit HflK
MHRAYQPEPDHHHHPRRPLRLLPLAPWLLLAYAATGLYSVKTNEFAVVRRCGKVQSQIQSPGLHFGLPWPIDRVDKLQMLELKRVVVGAGATDRQLGRQTDPQQAERLTGDRNLIMVSAVVQYRIENAPAFLFNVADVPKLIESAASSALSNAIAGMAVDDVFTVQRVAVQDEVLGATQAAMDAHRVGARVTSVSLEGVAPPQEVADAFRDVTSAREDSHRKINEAEAYANSQAELTKGDVQRIQLDAVGFAGETTAKAQGDADRFAKTISQLSSASRDLTARRLILETIEEVLPRMKKVVVDSRAGDSLDLGLIEEQP